MVLFFAKKTMGNNYIHANIPLVKTIGQIFVKLVLSAEYVKYSFW